MRRLWRGWVVVWGAALATIPIPYTGVEGGWVPTVWLLTIASVAAAVGVVEGGQVPWQLAGVLGAQALVAALVIGAAAWLVVPRLQARAPDGRAQWVVAAIVCGLVLLSVCHVYRSPVSSVRWTNIVGIWQ